MRGARSLDTEQTLVPELPLPPVPCWTPFAVHSALDSTPNDLRFEEAEDEVDFTLGFPPGFLASCFTS